LFLLAALGWTGALRAVSACSAGIAAAAWVLGSRLRAGAPPAVRVRAAPRPRGQERAVAPGALLAYAGVGACALTLEIGWTRLYGMVLLRTEYVLAVILAVYLAGTALGSLLAARAERTSRIGAALPLVACGAALAGLAVLPALSVWVQEREFPSLFSALALQSLLLAVCTLPTTIALGAWLPLLARRLGVDAAGARDLAPLLYGANCLGAAAGAAGTVALAIPLLGTTATVCLAAVALLACGAQLVPLRLLAAALPIACLAAWWLHAFPQPDRMLPPAAHVGRELQRYEDALTLNHVTQAADGQRTLLTDLQRMDATSDPDAVQIQADQARLPLLLHRNPHSILFLGLGTGISAGGSLPFAGLERSAVELSPGAIGAARTWFAPVNGGVMDAMQVEQDDARHYLLAHARRFDVIVGDLFHPDLAGMSLLLSVEQFQRVRAHLNPDGVFAQWLALNQFDGESLHAVLRSFRAAFPDGALFFDGMHLALVGSPGRQAFGAGLLAHAARLSPMQVQAQTGGEGPWTWLGRYCGPIDGGQGAVQTQLRPLIEFRLPRIRYRDPAPLQSLLQELLQQRPAAQLAAGQLGLAGASQGPFADAYLATGLALQAWIAALDGRDAASGQWLQLSYESNPHDRWVAATLADELFAASGRGASAADRTAIERVLRIYPDHLEALRALWHLDRADGRADACRDLARLRALAPLDGETASAAPDCGSS
jgi:spermidine synthase